jgi:SAM-dependent methyltransferase
MIRDTSIEGAVPAAADVQECWFVRGHVTFECMAALQASGLLETLLEGRSVSLPADAICRGLEPAVVDAVLRYLYGLGIVRRAAPDEYEWGSSIHEQDIAKLEMLMAYRPMFYHLPAMVAGQKQYGNGIARIAELDVQASARIGASFCYPEVIEKVRSLGARCIVDLGCGSAELLIQSCRSIVGITAIGIDCAEEAVRFAGKRVQEAGLCERISLIRGDILRLPEAAATSPLAEQRLSVDLVLSTLVFHEFAYPDLSRLMDALRATRAAFPAALLMLFETQERSDEELRKHPTSALEHHLFHRLSCQGIASADKWRPVFKETGYRIDEEQFTPMGGMLVLLVPDE